MVFRLLLATALVVPIFADDRHDDRSDDRTWSRNERQDDRREQQRIREMRRREATRNGRSNGNYGYGNNAPYGYGNGGYSNGGYGNGGYGNGGYGQGSSIVERTLQDLQSAASRNRFDGHERGHFNLAVSELQNMRSGAVDNRRVSRVLEALDHLSNADQLHPRDRQILARDRQALASMAGGYGYNGR